MDSDKPFFRFNPRAYEPGRCFESSTESCDVCGKPCIWKYTGNIYAIREAVACARCISTGRLAGYFADAHFSLHDIEFESPANSFEAEVLQKTPGVACFNPFVWPVLDGRPLAFLGYGEDEALLAVPEVRAAIAAAFAGSGWEYEGSPTSYALIFKELDGSRFSVAVDLD